MIFFENNMFLYLLFLVLFPILLLLSFKKRNPTEYHLLGKDQTNALKGVFIIFIFAHHFVQRMGNPGYLSPYRYVGYLAVSGFFLFSGYGIMSSFLKKENYLNSFLQSKIPRIYIPTVVSAFFVGIVAILMGYENMDIVTVILRALSLNLITRADLNWYVSATLIFYIFFYWSLKFFPLKRAVIILFLLNGLYVIGGYIFSLGLWWINTAFVFPLGVLMSYKKDLLVDMLNRFYSWFLISVSGLFAITFSASILGIVNTLIADSISGVAFGLLIAIISYRHTIDSKIFSFFGIISFELYLIHSQVFDIVHSAFTIKNELLTMLLFGIIVFFAYGFNKINNFLIQGKTKFQLQKND